MDKFPITVNGEKKLREELDRLTNIERPRIIDAISTAREHGDLKENAEYHAAKEQQSFAEGRIQDIKLKLSNSEIVDPKKITSSKVVFSAKVDLYDFEKEIEDIKLFLTDSMSQIHRLPLVIQPILLNIKEEMLSRVGKYGKN